jgi:hypothetical protein
MDVDVKSVLEIPMHWVSICKKPVKKQNVLFGKNCFFRTRGNLFLPVRLLVWADGRGTVVRVDSAARTELQGAPKEKVTGAKKYIKIPLGQAQGDAY